MTDLIAFITARLAEDEAWALAASQPYKYAAEGATVPPGGVHWTWVVGENWTPVTPDPAVDDTVGGPEHYGCPVNLASVEQWRSQGSDHGWPVHMMPQTIATEMVEVDSSAAGHIVRHDPARVLREVAAKRRLLGLIFAYEALDDAERGCSHTADQIAAGECAVKPHNIPALLALAAPYAGHPDYDPTWSPS